MSSGLLSIAASGVRAAQAALDVTAQNIANASTEGYVRRSVNLAEMAGSGGYLRFSDVTLSGVRVSGLNRSADAFRQAEVRRTGADSARAGIELSAYQNVESAVEQSGLYPAMTGFENSLRALAADPVDPALRTATLEQARTLTKTFNIAAQGLDTVGQGLRFDATDGVKQVNQSASELARINLQLARATPGTSDQVNLLDQRDRLLSTLSTYADISTSFAADQTVEVHIGGSGGPQLVTGGTANALAMSAAADGTISFTVGASAVTLSSGQLAGQAQGLVAVRDSRTTLDGIANNLIATANAAQASGVDQTGATGQPLFSGSGAAGIALALTAGTGLATAPAGAGAGSRDPANLNAFSTALNTADITGQIDGLLFTVSSAAQGRKVTADALGSIASSAKLALDSQAGVNLDEEAVNLVKYQQAFQASGKAIQIAADCIDTILALK